MFAAQYTGIDVCPTAALAKRLLLPIPLGMNGDYTLRA